MTSKEIIENVLATRGRFACEGYHERHHILPKCMRGTDDEDNLIDLYADEHFEVHKKLATENRHNKHLVYAYWLMAHPKISNKYEQRNYKITAEEYKELREMYAQCLSEDVERSAKISAAKKGQEPWCKGLTKDTNESVLSQSIKISEIQFGENNSMYNYVKTEESSKNYRDAALKRHEDKEYIKNQCKGLKGGNPEKNKKPVMCVETGVIYTSARDACKINGWDESIAGTIRRYCNRSPHLSCCGYHWKFLD